MLSLLVLFATFIANGHAMDSTSITMIESDALYGDTFDQSVYGKDILFLIWDSSVTTNRMYKSSKWDMLATEKDKWVRSRNVTVGEVDCAHRRSRKWCKNFAAFDISELEYPIIAYSINNEPYKHYNDSMEYPALTKLLFEYFERSCVYNDMWCTEEENELIEAWRTLTILEQLVMHRTINEATNESIREFEQYVYRVKTEVHHQRAELQHQVDKQDAKAILLNQVINENDPDEVRRAMEELDDSSL